jgi:hypothetical protein
MKLAVAFFKSEQFIVWVAINAILPVFMIGLLRQIDVATSYNLPMLTRQFFAVCCILIILVANIHYAARWRGTIASKFFIIIIFLNILSIFLTSDISFVTSLFDGSMYFDVIVLYYDRYIGVQ